MIRKLYVLLAILLVGWAWFTKSLYDDKKAAEAENKSIKSTLQMTIKQNQIKAKAFEEREKALINDRKEIENEYKKLLELKTTDADYSTWSNVRLPRSVTNLMY